MGAEVMNGFATNFSVGGFEIDAGDDLVLVDANGNGEALYVLGEVFFGGGLSQISNNVVGNGLNIYYDPDIPGNAYLLSARHSWSDNGVGVGGGELIP